jgi:uncharacterized protein YqgC (DUF456 family)
MDILLIIGIIIIFIIGIVGIIVPVIPSLPVIWGGILLYAILTNFDEVTMTIVVVTAILMIIGTALDFVSGIFGAKIYGASWLGIIGTLVGSIIGLILFNVLGMVLGSFIGAFIVEYIRYKKTHPALKAGFGTIIGFIFGVVVKISIAFLMIVIFIIALF